jgi:exonuclease III
MTSTFDDLLLVIRTYGFDIVTLSETWLKDNPQLLNHVSISGYGHEFRNREQIRGGGVGAYIKETVKYKRRKDIESKYPDLEHLWLEIQGRNKHSHLLLGTIYRSTRILDTQQWLEQMENMLLEITTSWDGLLILTGDININLLNSDAPLSF